MKKKKSKSEAIQVIMTGGTIDAVFDTTKDTVVNKNRSYLPEFFHLLNLHVETKFASPFSKDSRDILYSDRVKLLKLIEKTPYKRVIVTHGTYTMPDSAQFLKDQLKGKNKTIVFTGAMVPLKGFDFSDAGFNLGYALAEVQTKPPGVYVCFNGKTFEPHEVYKNRLKGRFEKKARK